MEEKEETREEKKPHFLHVNDVGTYLLTRLLSDIHIYMDRAYISFTDSFNLLSTKTLTN